MMSPFGDLADGGLHRRIRTPEEWEPPGLGYQRARDDFLAALATTPFADDLIMCGGVLHGVWLGETVFPADDFYFVSHDLIGMGSMKYLKGLLQAVADGEPRGESGTRFQASGASARQTNRSDREDELEFVFEHGYPQYLLRLPYLDADGRSGRLMVEVWHEYPGPPSDIEAFPRPTGGDPILLRTETPDANLECMLRYLLAPAEQHFGRRGTEVLRRNRAVALYSAVLLAETLQPHHESGTSPSGYVRHGLQAPTVFWWYTAEHHEHLGSLRFEWPADLPGTPGEFVRRLQGALAPLLDVPARFEPPGQRRHHHKNGSRRRR
ncbi:hypothetical protein [Actinomadura harenae]|uniref:Uncharacterized protein n=1 Tax=Actinomadura harenae TaxID=2483351 RepID=A0A3M2M2T4_9ACTN|nr:hypothetical protein [Actinomadura harenae]RMI43951.1 hypothetical protein EBO15_14730 [Actinomadura harenae]